MVTGKYNVTFEAEVVFVALTDLKTWHLQIEHSPGLFLAYLNSSPLSCPPELQLCPCGLVCVGVPLVTIRGSPCRGGNRCSDALDSCGCPTEAQSGEGMKHAAASPFPTPEGFGSAPAFIGCHPQ